MSEMWNSADLYGPRSEIARFRRLCIVPALPNDRDRRTHAIDFDRILRTAGLADGEPAARDVMCPPWNFRERAPGESGPYWIAFDTMDDFPHAIFERLAELFPTIAFACHCIAFDGESRGDGWFNPPPGAIPFSDGHPVPADYWGQLRAGSNRRAAPSGGRRAVDGRRPRRGRSRGR